VQVPYVYICGLSHCNLVGPAIKELRDYGIKCQLGRYWLNS